MGTTTFVAFPCAHAFQYVGYLDSNSSHRMEFIPHASFLNRGLGGCATLMYEGVCVRERLGEERRGWLNERRIEGGEGCERENRIGEEEEMGEEKR